MRSHASAHRVSNPTAERSDFTTQAEMASPGVTLTGSSDTTPSPDLPVEQR